MTISILPLVLLGNLFASKLVLDFGSNFECDYTCQKKLTKALPDMITHAEQKLAAIERSKTSRERRSAHGQKLCEAKIFEISMHDFYKFYVCPFMAVLLCEPGKECFKCNPAMRHYGSKFDKWSVTTCHPNRINHEKSSVCQYDNLANQFCAAQTDCPISIDKPDNFEKKETAKLMEKMCCQQKMVLGQKVVCEHATADRNSPKKIEVEIQQAGGRMGIQKRIFKLNVFSPDACCASLAYTPASFR